MKLEERKVFGIGFHKTGTTSLALALKVLGYSCNRGLDDLKRLWGLDRCVDLLRNDDYDPFLEYMERFDATLDNPWYLLYEELDVAFPKSKFILTLRDERKWLASCADFFSGVKNPYREWLYGTSEVLGYEEHYLKLYSSHIENVKKYFDSREGDLLIVNWENGDGWTELCQFLEKPIIDLPFPHLNKRGEKLWS